MVRGGSVMNNMQIGAAGKDMKVFNRRLVRSVIKEYAPIARYEIADLTELTPPTVTAIVRELIDAGTAEEIGRGESTGGRRPILLNLKPEAALMCAVRIQRGEAAVSVMDLRESRIGRSRLKLDTTDPDNVVAAIAREFESILKTTNRDRKRVLWCGVASPGLVNPDTGLIVRSSNLGWHNVPLGQMLSESLGRIPVCVENISNAAALAEKLYGSGKGYLNVVYLNLSVGIGAGIIMNGEVYAGSKGYAGEVGHMVLLPDDGPKCRCGRYGCFEAVCGTNAIVDHVLQEVDESDLLEAGVDPHKVSIEDITSSALRSIPQVQEILDKTAYLVGVAVANLVSILNPEVVILGGELIQAGREFIATVDGVVKERTLDEIGSEVRVVESSMDEDPALMGAYALALERVMQLDEW